MRGNEPRTMLHAFIDTVLKMCENHIPSKKKSASAQRHNIPRDRRILMRKRTSLHKQLTESQHEKQRNSIRKKIEEIEQQLKESHIHQRIREEGDAVNNTQRNPKYFYSYCKKFSKTKTQIGPLQTVDGAPTQNPQQTCEVLMQQYVSVFSSPQSHSVIHDPVSFFTEDASHQNHLSDIELTVDNIKGAIKELRSNSAAGPDGVPAILLLKCSEVLAHPIQKLWRCSLDTGVVPALLKRAIVCPVYKGGGEESGQKLQTGCSDISPYKNF